MSCFGKLICKPSQVVTSQTCSDDGNGAVNLQDLLYAVPRLLEVCDADSKKALWAVNRTLHHQIADHVTRLYWRPKSGADTSHRDSRALGLFSWPSVVQLTASGFTLAHTSEMQVTSIVMITRSFNLQQRLQHLDLSNTGLDDVIIAFIMEGKWPCLKRLALADNSLTDCGLETLKGFPLSTLQDLDVSGNKFHAAGIARLVQSSGARAGNMTPTARLFCYFPKGFSDRFGLTGSPKTFELTKLHLGGLHLDANAISVLVKCLWRLQVLDLSYNWLGCTAMAVFATGPWYSLTTLDLSHNRLDVGAVAELVKVDMPSLRDLNLYRNDLRIGAVAVLVEAEWPVLQSLQLEGQRLADADLLAYTNALTAVAQKWPALAAKQASPH